MQVVLDMTALGVSDTSIATLTIRSGTLRCSDALLCEAGNLGVVADVRNVDFGTVKWRSGKYIGAYLGTTTRYVYLAWYN